MNPRFLALLTVFFVPFQASSAEPSAQQGVIDARCGGQQVGEVLEIDISLYFPSPEHAIEAAAHVDPNEFTVEVNPSESTSEWLVRSVYRQLPELSRLRNDRRRFKQIASKNGGSFHAVGCLHTVAQH